MILHETRDNEITAINKIQPEAIKKFESAKSMIFAKAESSF